MSYFLSDADQVQMLRKLMLYWDGQWFLKTVEASGLEAAIGLNAQVRASFGRIEMRTLLKTLGKAQADDLADAMRLLETYCAAFLGKGLRAEFAALDREEAEIIVRQCIAFEGAKRAGLARVDQACVACETVWGAWLETLLPGTQLKVEYPLRQGKGDPYCQFFVEAGQWGSL
jgi:predicted ArsR family transcriptional regulator